MGKALPKEKPSDVKRDANGHLRGKKKNEKEHEMT